MTVFSELLALNPDSFTLRWRLHDDYGSYPSDELYGSIQVRFPDEQSKQRNLQFKERWNGDLYPMLAWDRTAGDYFTYVSFSPEPSAEVVVIDQALQTRIEHFVKSMPGLKDTTAETSQLGILFVRDGKVPITELPHEEAAIQRRARARCYVRCDGSVEVRLPATENALLQLLLVLASAYAIARNLHAELGTQTLARGRLSYKLPASETATIGTENDMWIEIRLGRDEFVERITPIIMALQRAGKTPPVGDETRLQVERVWSAFK